MSVQDQLSVALAKLGEGLSADVSAILAEYMEAEQARIFKAVTDAENHVVTRLHEQVNDLTDRIAALESPVVDPPDITVGKQQVAAFTPESGKTYEHMLIHGGLRVIDEDIHDVIYRDCDFRDADFLVHVRGNDTIEPSGWRFVDCTFQGATPEPDRNHSSGVLLFGVTNFQFIRCGFDHNGWTESGKRSNRNHNIYLSNVGNIHIVDCKIFNASAQGIKARGVKSLSVRGCEFGGNLIDIKTDSRESGGPVWIDKCLFESEGGIDSTGSEFCWSLHFEHHSGESELESVKITDCRWNAQPTMKNAVLLTLIGSGIGDATMRNCDISKWQPTTATRDAIMDQPGRLIKTNVIE
jgi:hypothetical protein